MRTESHTNGNFADAETDGVVHDAIQADGGEKKTDSAEYCEECSREARKEEGFANMVFHGLFVKDGESGVHVPNDRTNGSGNRGGIGSGAGEDGVALEGRIAGDGLRERTEKYRAEIFAKEAGLDVVGHADDFVSDAAARDGLAQRIFMWKKCVCKNLIDDGDAWRAGGFVREIAAVEEVDAEGVQIAGRGHVEFDDGCGIKRLFANGLEAIAAMSAGERECIGGGSRRDPGNYGAAALEFDEELHGALGRVAVQARIDGHSENAAGTKPNTYAGGAAKTAQAETSDA